MSKLLFVLKREGERERDREDASADDETSKHVLLIPCIWLESHIGHSIEDWFF